MKASILIMTIAVWTITLIVSFFIVPFAAFSATVGEKRSVQSNMSEGRNIPVS